MQIHYSTALRLFKQTINEHILLECSPCDDSQDIGNIVTERQTYIQKLSFLKNIINIILYALQIKIHFRESGIDIVILI